MRDMPLAKAPTMDEAARVAVYNLLREAKQAVLVGDSQLAEQLCTRAWELVPEPKYSWDSSYMCLLGVSKYLREAHSFDKAIALVEAYLSSGFHLGHEDGPLFWLGALHYEKGNLKEAYGYFKSANDLSRGRCFSEEAPRYRAFFKAYNEAQHAH